MDACEIFIFVCHGVLIGAASITGIIGNTISFIVLSRMQHSPTITILRALSVTDNGYLVINFLTRSVPQYSDWFSCNVSGYVDKYLWPVATLSINCTGWLTFLLTLYRYIAVTKPLHARIITTPWRTHITIAFIVVFTSIATVPRFLEYDVERNETTSCVDARYADLYDDRVYQIVYKTLLMLTLYAILPPVLCLIFTIRLAFNLRKAARQRTTFMSSSRSHPSLDPSCQKERYITKISMSVAIIYLVCQIPSIITVFTRLFMDLDYDTSCTAYYYYLNASEFLVAFNSSVNFFIYMMGTPSFRENLIGLLKKPLTLCQYCCYCKINSNREAVSASGNNHESVSSSDSTDTYNTYM